MPTISHTSINLFQIILFHITHTGHSKDQSQDGRDCGNEIQISFVKIHPDRCWRTKVGKKEVVTLLSGRVKTKPQLRPKGQV